MAHFAKLDNNNVVIQVTAVHNNVLLDSNSVEQESLGIQFLKNLFNEPNATWVQTSYNNNFRKQFAGLGFTYDVSKNKFIRPRPFASWLLDSNDDWQAPISYPETYTLNLKASDNTPIKDIYIWNESILNWALFDINS
jgi:hypothetical protein